MPERAYSLTLLVHLFALSVAFPIAMWPPHSAYTVARKASKIDSTSLRLAEANEQFLRVFSLWHLKGLLSLIKAILVN